MINIELEQQDLNDVSLMILTPYEISIIELMKDKNNHRILIDNLFHFKKKENAGKNDKLFHLNHWMDFKLLTNEMKIFFLNELNDDDFLYLLKRISKYAYYKNEEGCYFIIYDFFHTESYSLMEYFYIFFAKSIKILTRNHLSDFEKKLLWFSAISAYKRFYFKINDERFLSALSLKSFLTILKRDIHLIKELFEVYFQESNRLENQKTNHLQRLELTYANCLSFLFKQFFSEYLNKYGAYYFPKLKRKVILFLIGMGYETKQAINLFCSIFIDFYECDIHSANDIDSYKCLGKDYIKTTDDFDFILKEISAYFNLSQLAKSEDIYYTNKYLKDLKLNQAKDFINYFPKMTPSYILNTLKNKLPLNSMKTYALIYLNLMKYLFPNIQNDEQQQEEYKRHIFDSNRSTILAYQSAFFNFHYFCYKQKDDVFNRNNPFCFNKEELKEYFLSCFHNEYVAILIELKALYSLFFNDIDKVILSHIKNDKSLIDKRNLMYLYLCDKKTNIYNKYKEMIFLKENVHNIDEYFIVLYHEYLYENKKYNSFLGQIAIDKLRETGIDFDRFKFFDLLTHDEFKKEMDNLIEGKEDEIIEKMNIFKIIFYSVKTSYNQHMYHYDSSFEIIHKLTFFKNLKKHLFYHAHIFNDVKIKEKILKDLYEFNDNFHEIIGIHFYVAMNLQDLNHEDKFKFNEHDNYMIDKLSKPIELNKHLFLLKQEIPQIEYWIEQ